MYPTQSTNSLYSRFRNYVANTTMNKDKTLTAVLVLIFLQLADFVSTFIALSLQLAREGNPLFANVYYMLVGKIVVIALLLMGYAYVNRTKQLQKTYTGILAVFIPVYLVIVINNLRFLL